MSLKIKGSKTPFVLEIVLSGFFQFNHEISDEDLDPIAHVNMAAILFPFLRQVVADTTTKGGFAPLLLPSVNFVESYKNRRPLAEPETCTTSRPK